VAGEDGLGGADMAEEKTSQRSEEQKTSQRNAKEKTTQRSEKLKTPQKNEKDNQKRQRSSAREQ
jgi:hypothetical protein